MATIAYKDGSTEHVKGVATGDVYDGHLVMKDSEGNVIGERDGVATISILTKAE